MTDIAHDVSDEADDGTGTDDETFFTPNKAPQVEAWKVPGAEDLPDDVKSTPIPE